MTFEKPRRVLIVVENLPVPLDRRVWMEALALTDAGYRVSVLCPKGRGWLGDHEVIDGIHVYRYPEPPEAHSGAVAYAREYLHAMWYWFRMAPKIRRERGFDVIQGCNPPDLIFLLALWYRLRGVRYVFDHHDVCPELFEAKFGKRGVLYAIMRIWERMTFATASVSIATNESFRQIALKRCKMPAEDVFVVRSAPRIDTFIPSAGNIVWRKGAKTLLGYVGVIGQQEGMDLLVLAVEHLIRKLGHRDIHVVIIGFGPQLPEVERDVRARGLERYFTFAGALYGAEMLEVLNSIDIGVSPDPKNAMNDISTMNKVMEYMTLEKPVVQFDLTEGRASAGDAALYARPNDPVDFAIQVARLIDDPALGVQMGKTGRKRVLESLSWEHSIPPLLAAYDRVFAKRGR
jgi:glycosyltransferase involved in cell wall biosynthesis